MKRVGLISFLLLLTSIVFAQASGFNKMTEQEKMVFSTQLKASSATTKTLQCNFIQKKEMSMLEETAVSKGMMYFKSPDALRWEYTSPQAYAFIMSKGQSMLKNNKGTNKLDAQSSKMIKSMTEMIMGMINGNGLIDNKNFSATYYSNQKQILIKLIPKNSKIKMMFSSIQAYVDPKTYSATMIEMNEAGGDVTTITLFDIKKNLAISDDKFKIDN